MDELPELNRTALEALLVRFRDLVTGARLLVTTGHLITTPGHRERQYSGGGRVLRPPRHRLDDREDLAARALTDGDRNQVEHLISEGAHRRAALGAGDCAFHALTVGGHPGLVTTDVSQKCDNGAPRTRAGRWSPPPAKDPPPACHAHSDAFLVYPLGRRAPTVHCRPPSYGGAGSLTATASFLNKIVRNVRGACAASVGCQNENSSVGPSEASTRPAVAAASVRKCRSPTSTRQFDLLLPNDLIRPR